MAYLHKKFVDFMAVKSNFFISKFQTRLKNQKIYMSIFKANYQVGASNLTYKAFQSLSYFRNIIHNVIMVAIKFSPGLRNDK